MDNAQRVYLAYRPIFGGANAGIRNRAPILRLITEHRSSTQTILNSLGQEKVISILKSLLERRVFESELRAKLEFPQLFTTSPAQEQQHHDSEVDAARSEAEALEEIIDPKGASSSLKEEVWDSVSEAEDEATSPLPDIGLVQTPAVNMQPKLAEKVPSLYPVYVPMKTQHLIFTRAQQILEDCCFEFSSQWMPDLLVTRRWDCSEAMELNLWIQAAMKRLDKLPAHCFALEPMQSLSDTLMPLCELRHSAVHRHRRMMKSVLEMVQLATVFAKTLRDDSRAQRLGALSREVACQMRALELNKSFLETRLKQELDEIARKRKELDAKEEAAMSSTLREDMEHDLFVGDLLANRVGQILDPLKTEAEGCTNIELVGGKEEVQDLTSADNLVHHETPNTLKHMVSVVSNTEQEPAKVDMPAVDATVKTADVPQIIWQTPPASPLLSATLIATQCTRPARFNGEDGNEKTCLLYVWQDGRVDGRLVDADHVSGSRWGAVWRYLKGLVKWHVF